MSRRHLSAFALVALAMTGVAACNSGETTINLGTGPSGGTVVAGSGSAAAAANQELTPQQKAKLLADIQKDPNKLKSLTLPEKRYIRKIAAAKGEAQRVDRSR